MRAPPIAQRARTPPLAPQLKSPLTTPRSRPPRVWWRRARGFRAGIRAGRRERGGGTRVLPGWCVGPFTSGVLS